VQLGVIDDGFGGGDDVFVASVVVGLGNVDVDKLETSLNASHGGFDARTVVEVNVYLDAIGIFKVIDQIAHVIDTDIIDFALTDFYQNRCLLGDRRQNDGLEGRFVVEVKGPKSPVFGAGLGHAGAGSITVKANLT